VGAEKIGMGEFATSLDLVDCVKEAERRLDPSQNVLRIKKSWPVILGAETQVYCKFMVTPRRGASEAVNARYRAAMYGK
jgi:hypothetical protein